MFNGLTGGAVAARRGMYRHSLISALMPLLGPLPAGRLLALTSGAGQWHIGRHIVSRPVPLTRAA